MTALTLEQRAWQHLDPSTDDDLPRAELLRGDAVTPESVDWLWEGWLAAGKLHILGGQPGTGKTTIALALAASITTGGGWPDGKRAELGTVVVWSGEDDPADTLAPRLRAAGTDMQRVHFVQGVREGLDHRPFNPSQDVGALRTALAELSDVRLLIVDPIVSAVSGDSHKNAEVRRGLQPLVDLAREHRCALLGITHFTKGTSGREPVERITGSLAFGALARLVLVTAKGEAGNGEPARRFLARAKSNIGPDGGGFIYDLSQGELPDFPGVMASSVLWGSALEGSARELLAGAEQQEDDPTGDAAGFLHELLRYGPRPAKGIFAEAGSAGFSKDVMHRAKRKIGAVALKQGMEGGWAWRLPTSEGSEGGTQNRSRSSRPSGTGLLPSMDDGPF
ncbi:AAA family ATPase [Lysobacter panacisoli]|uniref:AAA+ ATPase domain-containing protein n=1 Tax=Lysobacter panacisoli TaxID=1255263 RepID=A0ABP9LAM6_9GAMM|nr:AAA family ATPase [Lysobacter panacisoli]